MDRDTDRKNEEPPDGASRLDGAAPSSGAVAQRNAGLSKRAPGRWPSSAPGRSRGVRHGAAWERPRARTGDDGKKRAPKHHRSSRQPKGLVKDQARRRPRRRQLTLGGRSGGPKTAGIKRGSSRTSQAPAVEASTGARLERSAARSRSGGLVASLGASGATGARPQEGPLQGRRRRGWPGLAVAASSASPLVTSGEWAGMSWPTSQSPQLAWADWREPSAINASTTTISQQRRNRVWREQTRGNRVWRW